jgi:UDP-glucuronate 4-epimerase
MANYLVTGAAGFIGSRVSELLLEEGHTVIGCDNLNTAYDVRIKNWRLDRLKKRSNFRFVLTDISTWDNLAELNQTAEGQKIALDAVINLAARAGVRQSVLDPWAYFETNTTGTLNLLEFCRQEGIPKFILASTSSVYGSDAPLPTPETASSDAPLQPYAASKKSAEVLCHAYHFLHGIDFTQWIREGRKLKLIGNGEQTRGFTYIDDIARGTIMGLKSFGYEVINLGGHETIKIIELIQRLEDLIGKKALIEQYPADPADMLANWADVHKANRILGWEPQVSLDDGITRLVNWYEKERDWASLIATS